MTTHTVKHHLSEDLIFNYATGRLPEAFNLAVATHISMCDACRSAAEAYDVVGGQVLEQQDHVAVQDDSFSKTMALIKSGSQTFVETEKPKTDVPSPLYDYIGGSLKDVKWTSIGMGAKQCILRTSEQATARLLYIPAGQAMPHHSHAGTELTLVLQGAFEDEINRFNAGDIEIADQHVHHTPTVIGDQDCICLAVTDAPLKFDKLLHRVVQPFLKF